MLEHPSIRRYSSCHNPLLGGGVESENPSGADNQQETSSSCTVLDPNWIVGFVDGEGCFSVSVHRSSMMRRHRGWQLQPVFHIYQHRDHRDVLEAMIAVFGCGRVRPKGPNSSVWTFAVDGLRNLEDAVLPFFEQHPPVVKRGDFEAFSRHRSFDAEEATSHSERVRAPGPHCLWHECQRQAASQDIGASTCRILRDCTRGSLIGDCRPRDEDTVRPSWRHEELGRNDLAARKHFLVSISHQL